MGTQLEFDFYKEQLGEVAPFPVLKKKWLEDVTGKTGTLPELEYFYALQTGLSTTASIGSGLKTAWVPDGAVAAYNAITGQLQSSTISFSRSSTALWNPAGDYEEYATNVLRRENGVGMILEPGAENLSIWSNDFTQWTANGTAAVEAAQTSAPMSGMMADRITVTSGGPNRVSLLTSVLTAGTYTFQCLLKPDDISHVAIRTVEGSGTPGGFSDGYAEVNFSAETIAIFGSATVGSVTLITNGWYIVSVTIPLVGGAVVDLRLGGAINATQSGTKFYAWGVVYSEAAGASTPIITAGSTATRAIDELTIAPTPTASLDWHVRYDDDSEDVIATGVTGAYLIDPADLTRPEVKLIWATEA